MPELPEVHTTVEGLKKKILGKTIMDVWSDFHIGTTHKGKNTIKNKKYFDKFKKEAKGAKIKSLERWGKNILINLNNGKTIVIHMKMTGHLMVGKYKRTNGGEGSVWIPLPKGPLQDPFNKFIHLVFSLSDNKHLVLSDMRKFASVNISKTNEVHLHERVGNLGIDALKVREKEFEKIIKKKKNLSVKAALTDQTAIAGIGNIYSDEILWRAGIHPLSHSGKIPSAKFREMFDSMQKILKFSIKQGGDSKSDYRNAFGEKGNFQNFHKAYGRKGQECPKERCGGIIERMVIKGRSAHFCPKHQKKYA